MKYTILSIDGRRLATLTSAFAATLLIAGCGPVRLTATANIPTPLVVKAPIGVALFVPKEFSEYVHKEERWGTEWNIDIGKAQADAMSRLLNAMFERVIIVDSLNAGKQLSGEINAILEPSVEEYAFVTPRDAGSPFFAVSIKYRVNVYSPDGKLADSWGFTGYGTAPAGGLSNTEPLEDATALAMRDAGAKLAVEFRDQAIVRDLLPDPQSTDGPGAAPAAGTPEESSESSGEQPEESPMATPASEGGAAGEAPAAVPSGEPGASSEEAEEAEEALESGTSESAPETQSESEPEATPESDSEAKPATDSESESKPTTEPAPDALA